MNRESWFPTTSKKVVCVLSLFLMMVLLGPGVVPAPAGKPPSPGAKETPATADLLEHPNAHFNPPACGSGFDSVFQDGGGPYTPDDGTYFRSSGDLWVQALSGSTREMDLYLPQAICDLTTDLKTQMWAKQGVKLSIQAVRDVPPDGEWHIVGQRQLEAPGYNLGYNHYFVWNVDANGNGTIGRGDTSYNVVWQNGISVRHTGNVYELDTFGTASETAVLRYKVGKTVYLSAPFYMPLKLTVTVQ